MATRKPGLRAAFLQAEKDARAIQQAEAARWDSIICMDHEDVSTEDKAWADDYWRRTFKDAA